MITINPLNIVPWNEAYEPEKVARLTQNMTKNGWNDRPIIMIDGINKALTGSHRIQAAIEAELDEIPAELITDDMFTSEQWEEFDLCHDTDDLLYWIRDAAETNPELNKVLDLIQIEADNEH